MRKSKPVYYSQCDDKWKNIIFSNHNNPKQTICSSGCGATTMAMILAEFKDKNIKPPEVAEIIVKNGFRTFNNGVDWSYFLFASKHYNLKFKQTHSTDEVIKALKERALIIASMGIGYFTNFGHFIILWGLDEQNKQILVNDPNSTVKTKASYDLFRKEARNYFIYYEPERMGSVELKDWEKQAGIDSVDNLNKKGLLNNPDDWKNKLGENVPNWLFFVMMDRLSNFKGGK